MLLEMLYIILHDNNDWYQDNFVFGRSKYNYFMWSHLWLLCYCLSVSICKAV